MQAYFDCEHFIECSTLEIGFFESLAAKCTQKRIFRYDKSFRNKIAARELEEVGAAVEGLLAP
jgi:hypothetical protein